MAAQNFEKILAIILQNEGGYVNNRRDPGGATNFGITQNTFTAWLLLNHIPATSVRNITRQQVAAIYRTQYWSTCRCDELPSGVDLVVMDLAVNSGVTRSIKFLQKALGFTGKDVDGHIGVVTLSRINGPSNVGVVPAATIIQRDCALRLSFLQALTNWKWFGKGWRTRVAFVQKTALQMAAA